MAFGLGGGIGVLSISGWWNDAAAQDGNLEQLCVLTQGETSNDGAVSVDAHDQEVG